jgi:hypothetical protein
MEENVLHKEDYIIVANIELCMDNGMKLKVIVPLCLAGSEHKYVTCVRFDARGSGTENEQELLEEQITYFAFTTI